MEDNRYKNYVVIVCFVFLLNGITAFSIGVGTNFKLEMAREPQELPWNFMEEFVKPLLIGR